MVKFMLLSRIRHYLTTQNANVEPKALKTAENCIADKRGIIMVHVYTIKRH